jgi:PAS domain S-box-containing protein
MAALAVAAGRAHGELQRLTLATGVAGLVLANALVRLGLQPSPEQTTHLVLALVGVGVFVHVRAYLLLSAIAWAGWVLAIPAGAPSTGWGQQTWFLLTATALGAVLMLARLYQDHESERAGMVEEGLSQDLAVSLGWYRTLFHESPALMCIHDAAGRIEEVNPAGLQALGYDRAHVVGSNILEFMIPVSPDGPSEYLEEVVNQGRAEGFLRARRSDGEVRIWEYRSTRLQSGADVQVLATAADVTDLDQARDAVGRLVPAREVPEDAPSLS